MKPISKIITQEDAAYFIKRLNFLRSKLVFPAANYCKCGNDLVLQYNSACKTGVGIDPALCNKCGVHVGFSSLHTYNNLFCENGHTDLTYFTVSYSKRGNLLYACCNRCGSKISPSNDVTLSKETTEELTEVTEYANYLLSVARARNDEKTIAKLERELHDFSTALSSWQKSLQWAHISHFALEALRLLPSLVRTSIGILEDKIKDMNQIRVSRNLPVQVGKDEQVDVELQLQLDPCFKGSNVESLEKPSGASSAVEVEVLETIPMEAECKGTVGRAKSWQISLSHDKIHAVRYILIFGKTGNFEIGPAGVFRGRELVGQCAPSFILVAPKISFRKLFPKEKMTLGEEAMLEIRIENQDTVDILDVKAEDEVPDSSDFTFKGDARFSWKRIGRGETRVLKSTILTKTVLGSYSLAPARLSFKDETGNVYSLKSNDLVLRVVSAKEESRRCLRCGASMLNDAVFCGVCGSKLNPKSEKNTMN